MAIVMEIDEQVLAAKFEAIFPHLDERQRRLLMAAEARALGHGGIRLVARAAGVSARPRCPLGVDELDAGRGAAGPGAAAGRRPQAALTGIDRGLGPALLDRWSSRKTRGDPMSPLRWTTKSTRNLAAELTRQGHQVSPTQCRRPAAGPRGYSLQGNAKTLEGRQHPDRDAQFRYINEQVTAHQAAGDPVISVDAKKKELVGEFKNGGPRVAAQGRPGAAPTSMTSPASSWARRCPYGVYDLAANAGWVTVGTDHDTAAFAVESIRRWWTAGRPATPTRGPAAADHRRRGRLQRLPHPRRGRPSWPPWPPRPAWRSPSATSRRAPPSGTRSSTGCSPTSP